MNGDGAKIRRCLQRLARELGLAHTFCPSEAARLLVAEHWRDLMPAVREEAAHLVEAGELDCTQRGIRVNPRDARGAIRLSRARPPR